MEAAAYTYDVSFAHLCSGTIRPILSILADAVGPGAAVLDVGTGTGRLATETALAGFRVTAVDPNPAMVDFARRRAPQPAVSWGVASAPGLPFRPGAFDGVVANFVVNHANQPRRCVADLHRVTRPNGIVLTTIWGSDPSPLTELWSRIIERSGAARVPGTRLPVELDFERSPQGLAALHRSVGATVDRAAEFEWDFIIDPLDLWQAVAGGIAGIGALYKANPPDLQQRMSEAYWEITQELCSDGRLRLPSRASYVLARTT